MRAWLTPDNLPNEKQKMCFALPEDEYLQACFWGALVLLTKPYNWEQNGTKTPEETAHYFDGILAELLESGGCGLNIGTIVWWSDDTIPDNYLECNGGIAEQSAYPELYALWGNRFGYAALGYFRLPDIKGRTIVGEGLSTWGVQYTLADTIGEHEHTLTIAELPEHNHSAYNAAFYNWTQDNNGMRSARFPLGNTASGNTGNDEPHNNMQPSIILIPVVVAK